jgi:hypothetical protein
VRVYSAEPPQQHPYDAESCGVDDDDDCVNNLLICVDDDDTWLYNALIPDHVTSIAWPDASRVRFRAQGTHSA